MDLKEISDSIPIYIGVTEIMQILGVGRNKATSIFREIKAEKSHIPLPNEKKIALDWIIEKYGHKAMKKKKDTQPSTKTTSV